MKHLIVPAMAALLFAGLPAQAQTHSQRFIQTARNDADGQDQGDRDHGGDQGDSRGGGNGTTGASNPGAARPGGGGDHGAAMNRGGGQAEVGGRSDRSGGGPNPSENGNHMGRAVAAGDDEQGRTRNRSGRSTNDGQRVMGTGSNAGAAAATRGARMDRGGVNGGRTGTAALRVGGSSGGTTFGTRPPNWNQYPRQFNATLYQRNINSPRQFHWQNYNRPSGWYYQRWGYGQIFPSNFWVQDYWLNDYWMFDLAIPPYGYVWVRYGDDAVLIDRRSGRILQVNYGVFY